MVIKLNEEVRNNLRSLVIRIYGYCFKLYSLKYIIELFHNTNDIQI